MDFSSYVARLDSKIHEFAPEPEDVIGAVWVNESAVIWSGRNGFAEAQRLGETMVAFALHEDHGGNAQIRFGDDFEGDLDGSAHRLAAFLSAIPGVSAPSAAVRR